MPLKKKQKVFVDSKRVFLLKRTDNSAAYHCCVPLCTASTRFNSFVSFHRFPQDRELQKRWISNIKRDKFTPTERTRVCSRHFKRTDLVEPPNPSVRSARRLQSGAVPVLFEWNSFTLPTSRPDVWETREQPERLVDHESPVDVREHQDHDYASRPEPSALDLALERIADLEKQIRDISIRNSFGLERFAASDEDIRFYTRFATLDHLMAFWRLIEPATHTMLTHTEGQPVAQSVHLQSLKPIDEFFLFMNYLSLGLMQRDLGHRFKIHQSTVSSIIKTWGNFLYTVLGSVSIWMSEEAVKASLPDVFLDYSDTQLVLNCAELRCQTQSSLLHQSEEFSTCRSHCTFKGLIGMAPNGTLTFVSGLYAGSISNKEIVKQCGIVPLLTPTMAVMVDKGFVVEDCVPCKVYIPATMSAPEVKETQSIARLRGHVERLIRRVKEHQIFSSVMPLSLAGSLTQLYTVACLLVNYENGPLVKAW